MHRLKTLIYNRVNSKYLPFSAILRRNCTFLTSMWDMFHYFRITSVPLHFNIPNAVPDRVRTACVVFFVLLFKFTTCTILRIKEGLEVTLVLLLVYFKFVCVSCYLLLALC